MLTKKERERILRDYPETISKEQFYKLCQISKNQARELLIRGVVPCQITRRATHKYVIATVDVIAYLESLPRIRRKRGGAATMPRQSRSVTLTQVPPALADQLRALYDETLEPFPDVMDPGRSATPSATPTPPSSNGAAKAKSAASSSGMCVGFPSPG